MADLTDEQLLRYSRQVVLPEVDEDGQQRLARSTVLLPGLGGLGSPAATYLAAAGVGRLILADPDTVELSNLHRQILHRSDRVGMPKAQSAKLTLAALNPDVEVVTHECRLRGAQLQAAVRAADIVVDGTDNFASRFELNRACLAAGRPLVYGAVVGLEGQASVFCGGEDKPCYACLYRDMTEDRDVAPTSNWETCSGQGVLGPVAGIVACIQATEALKLLLGHGSSLSGRLMLIDARSMQFHSFRLQKDPRCDACGAAPGGGGA